MTDYYIKKGRKYVLVPQSKELDTDSTIILNCAFRYALGRMTYVVDVVANKLISEYSRMNVNYRIRIAKEIEEAITDGHAGWDCDIQDWKKVMHLYRDENHCRIKAYKAAKSSIQTLTKEEIAKPFEVEVSDEYEIVDAVKMDGRYYSLDMSKYYHTVKELNEKGEEL